MHIHRLRNLFMILLLPAIIIMFLWMARHHTEVFLVQNVYTKQVSNRPGPCTISKLREYYSNHHRFPSEGKWIEDSAGASFQPAFCQMAHSSIPSDVLEKCLASSDLSSILMIGDSNSNRYFAQLVNSLSSLADSPCAVIRTEQLPSVCHPDKTYYSRGNNTIDGFTKTHHRYCGSCHGVTSVCNIRGVRNVSLEVVPMPSLMDTSLRIMVPDARRKIDHDLWAPTTQEFLLRYYLNGRYPDIVLFFVPFSHVKQGVNTVERSRLDMTYFHGLVKHYIPKNTSFFYVTGPAEHEHAKSKKWKYATFDGMLANEKIHKLNQMMYEVLEEDLLDPQGNVYGSLDLVGIGESRGNWTEDGIHMKSPWYSAVISQLLQVICNSVHLDNFRNT